MPKDKRIDVYISKSADFARPVLKHLRKVIHSTCPDVEEELKWGMPGFMYKGKILCGIAAFKQHAAFWFWKASRMNDPNGLLKKSGKAMGSFGRLTHLSDLPSDRVLAGFIKQAMKLNESTKTPPASPKKPKPVPRTPAYLLKALRTNTKALATFTSFTPGHKREYIAWIVDAKSEETRKRRIATAIEWMAEGKKHNWKYTRK